MDIDDVEVGGVIRYWVLVGLKLGFWRGLCIGDNGFLVKFI